MWVKNGRETVCVEQLLGTTTQPPPPPANHRSLSSIPLSSHILPQPQLFWAFPPPGGVGGDGASEGIQMFSTVNVNHNDSKLFSTCIQILFASSLISPLFNHYLIAPPYSKMQTVISWIKMSGWKGKMEVFHRDELRTNSVIFWSKCWNGGLTIKTKKKIKRIMI